MTAPAARVECVACGATIDAGVAACPTCLAPQFAPQRRVVSVLFADLTGYTRLCSELDPEDVHLLIRPVMNALCQVCQSVGGVVPGIAGDGFMAVFGARHTHEHDPLRAIVAAVRLQRVVQERRATYPRLPELRVGINAGEVLVAPSWEPGGFTVSGDVVNVGQRLCAAAPPGGVLVSAAAADLAPGITAWSPDEAHALRNRPVSVSARLLDWTTLPEQLPTARIASHVPLVGRSVELERLDGLLTSTAGAAALVVVGEPGVGKTRLVDEWVARHPELRILRTACASFGTSDLTPLRDLVDRALAEPDADAAVRDLPLHTHRQVRRLLAGGSDPDDESDAVAASVALLQQLGRLQDTLVVVDDAHWAEPPVLSALDQLAAVSGPHLTVVATSRDELPVALPHLVLTALDDDDAAALAERFLPGATTELLRFVLSRAGGNPLFIEQCAGLLLEDGTVTVDDSGCHVVEGSLGASRVPTSMRLFVGARLDLLEPEERAALAAAATLGDVIELDALAHLAPDARGAVDRVVARGYLRWRTGSTDGPPTLEFSHALVRDVSYASQTRGARQRAHRSNAGWYARRDDLDAVELRATHLEAALELATDTGDDCDLVRDAFDALVRQAELGLVERLRSARRALAKAGRLLDGHQQCRLDPFRYWLTTARAASTRGETDVALKVAGDAIALAASRGSAEERAEAELVRADALWEMADAAAASHAYGAARALFVAAGDPVGEARAALGQAHCVEVSSGHRAAIDALKNALHVALAAGARPVALVAVQELALLSYVDGAAAVGAALETAAALHDLDDELGRTRISLARASVCVAALNAPAATAHADDAVRRADDLGDASTLFNGILFLLEAQVLGGDLDAAGHTLERCTQIAASRPTRRMHVSTTLISSLLHSRSGRPTAARAALDAVTDDVEALGLFFRRDQNALRAYVALETGHFDDAIDQARSAVTLDAVLDQPFLALRPRLTALAACVAARRSPADDAAGLRADAVAMGGVEIEALAARWLAQDELLHGRRAEDVPAPPDVVEARALDLENAALAARDARGFAAAAETWGALGDTVWRARALTWHAEAAGDASSMAEADAVLERLGADPGLTARFRADLLRAWSA